MSGPAHPQPPGHNSSTHHVLQSSPAGQGPPQSPSFLPSTLDPDNHPVMTQKMVPLVASRGAPAGSSESSPPVGRATPPTNERPTKSFGHELRERIRILRTIKQHEDACAKLRLSRDALTPGAEWALPHDPSVQRAVRVLRKEANAGHTLVPLAIHETMTEAFTRVDAERVQAWLAAVSVMSYFDGDRLLIVLE